MHTGRSVGQWQQVSQWRGEDGRTNGLSASLDGQLLVGVGRWFNQEHAETMAPCKCNIATDPQLASPRLTGQSVTQWARSGLDCKLPYKYRINVFAAASSFDSSLGLLLLLFRWLKDHCTIIIIVKNASSQLITSIYKSEGYYEN